jgi:hypothetical protein
VITTRLSAGFSLLAVLVGAAPAPTSAAVRIEEMGLQGWSP